ncbi:hypothetical protein POM88_039985 [Heracleum sosnowskyi]|uniref:NB-ARC domain-containing protein n=1 Tax=Heracleum sosnowskyi TaxID=360622 RepID=A0AAD8HDN5_9APIA|nr:hypothetical protein POM88_039985 [Heracleum sosnowskyi]
MAVFVIKVVNSHFPKQVSSFCSSPTASHNARDPLPDNLTTPNQFHTLIPHHVSSSPKTSTITSPSTSPSPESPSHQVETYNHNPSSSISSPPASPLLNTPLSVTGGSPPSTETLKMGGQGKTTLARMVYNKDATINMLPKRMWVTVSDDFDFMKILNQIVVSLTSRPSVLENAGLIKDLREKLKGEKFLLVLDDVWNEKPEEWEKLRNSLLGVGGARGSNILVTTHSQKVIDVMRCYDPYRVQKLSDEDSWELFKQRAFFSGGVLESEVFVGLGKRMVKRCGAIKTLGVYCTQRRRNKSGCRSKTVKYGNQKDSYVYKDELIQIWMALGFLIEDNNALIENTGNQYFNILLWNSLLQDTEKDEYGNITNCKMHDLVHDLALDVSSNSSATIKPSHEKNKVSKAIHKRLEGFKDVKPNMFKVHFDTVEALYAEASIFNIILLNLKNLRYLVICNPNTRYMFTGIERLTHLQTLPHFVLSRDQNCLVGQLGGLKNLRGVLKIYGLSEVANREEASKAKLCEKADIQYLLLSWRNNEDEREYNDEDVMKGLKPHLNLKELTVEDFMGIKFATWISMMTNLVKITLKDHLQFWGEECEAFEPVEKVGKFTINHRDTKQKRDPLGSSSQ